jgi:hypothetical protein
MTIVECEIVPLAKILIEVFCLVVVVGFQCCVKEFSAVQDWQDSKRGRFLIG